jgi:hypothetical protein
MRCTLKPWNPLERRIFGYMRSQEPRLSFAGFARRAGVHHSGLRRWFKITGSSTAGETLAKLAAVLGLSEAEALQEAGGQTAHDAHVRNGRAQAAGAFATNRLKGYTPKVVRKRAAAQTGLKRSPETVARLRAANGAPEQVARAREWMLARQRTFPMRALTRLGHLLGREPAPPPDRVREFAEQVAGELGATPDLVLTAWRPTLVRKGLVPKGGRPRKGVRLRIMMELRATWPRKRDGDMGDGFWREVAKRFSDAEGEDVDEVTARVWWSQQPEGVSLRGS